MGKYVLPKRTLILWQLRGLVLCLCLIWIARWILGAYFWNTLYFKITAVVSLVVILLYIPLYFISYKIEVKNSAIIIRRGVIVKTIHIMPFSRLLYAQSFASPLARVMKMAAITLKATRSYVIIPEITTDEVEAVIKSLVSEEKK